MDSSFVRATARQNAATSICTMAVNRDRSSTAICRTSTATSASYPSAPPKAKRPMCSMAYSIRKRIWISRSISPTPVARVIMSLDFATWQALRASPAQSQGSEIPYVREGRCLHCAHKPHWRADQYDVNPRQLGRLAPSGGINHDTRRRPFDGFEEALRISEGKPAGQGAS